MHDGLEYAINYQKDFAYDRDYYANSFDPAPSWEVMRGMSVCLGRLESSDFGPLPAQGKDAVHSFWSTYYASSGEPAEIQFDVLGFSPLRKVDVLQTNDSAG